MFEWIVGVVERTGYVGVAVLMFLENVFPPIPSELIMPLAGFASAKGDLQLSLVVLSGTAGAVAGAVFWYFVGLWFGTERLKRWADRHGRWITLHPEEIDKATRWFQGHAGRTVLAGRLVPAVRTLISVPAGVSGMSIGRFMVYSSLGTALWSTLLACAGYLLEDQYSRVAGYVDPVSKFILIALVAFYLYRVVTFRR
ncbi:DedA family protein [Arenibaculum pallidiluteum]|uniref:DedA family protein n=1 Tax=Arenibaculum pallidiluteum TaxID=2812559 RepID=UPI001A96952D|nr:VTT domain-containing protein [Arenibaculum pallidiluteum]